jgi:hypothetical protein
MFDLKTLIDHAEEAYAKSEEGNSKLNEEILKIKGMSGIKTRHLYNNICNLSSANYLEIGTYKGSSFISSLHKNDINALAIDNWSEFDCNKEEFIGNVNHFCPNQNFGFIEKDSFEIDKNDVNRFFETADIYLYDGCHKYESHKKAITHFCDFLSKYSIIIIDDWRTDGNWERVQRGTYEGIEESGLIVHKKIEIITKQEETGPHEYWNGFGLFVCEKK